MMWVIYIGTLPQYPNDCTFRWTMKQKMVSVFWGPRCQRSGHVSTWKASCVKNSNFFSIIQIIPHIYIYISPPTSIFFSIIPIYSKKRGKLQTLTAPNHQALTPQKQQGKPQKGSLQGRSSALKLHMPYFSSFC